MNTSQIVTLCIVLMMALPTTVASISADAEELTTCTMNGGECLNPDAETDPSNNQSSDPSIVPGICMDDRDECPEYGKKGYCETKSDYMHSHCKKTCDVCPDNLEVAVNEWGEPQEIFGENATSIKRVVRETHHYMTEKVYKKAMYLSVQKDCLNRDKLCSRWASQGECKKNPMWMTTNCAPACQTCEKIDHRIRCPFDATAPKAWGPGDLDKTFENIITDPHYQQYEPTVLSRPEGESTSLVKPTDQLTPEDKPWLISLENFLTPEECDRLIFLGGLVGYKQSYEVGQENFDGTYQAANTSDRTSFNAWCFDDKCYKDHITQQILHKVQNVTGVPMENYEFFQLLRYEEGGLYRQHDDYVPGDLKRSQGVRIMTLFIYLNDMELDDGGETFFNRLGWKITPRKGKALLWPNVYSGNPDAKDGRLMHEALPVRKGVKYAGNLWIHQRDFQTPFYNLCN